MKLASSLKLIALSAALVMTSMVVMASADPQQLTIRDIVTQQTQLRAQVSAGKGAFKDLNKSERQALVERQDRVLQMLGGAQTLDEMPPDKRTVVFNDLEWIKAADERMVCEYTRSVGSNRLTSVCMTAKAQREYRENTQNQLRRGGKCDSCAGD